jgi:hypothetical protein
MVDYSYILTNKSVADILTKSMTIEQHVKFTKGMGRCKYEILMEMEIDLRLSHALICSGLPSTGYSGTHFPAHTVTSHKLGFSGGYYGNHWQCRYAWYQLFI